MKTSRGCYFIIKIVFLLQKYVCSLNSRIFPCSNGTLKRQHSYKSRGSIESMGGRSGNSTPLCGTPVRERSSPFGERSSPFSEKPPPVGCMRNSISASNNIDSMPSSMVSYKLINNNCRRFIL